MKFWSEEEIKTLTELWKARDIVFEDILKVLPSRTKRGIEHKANELNLPSWTKREQPTINYEYLKKLREVIEG